ncbi:MAG TPA: PilZ domain-containing protein [Spirochaetota bacterium]|nr:PilZ domain-containing protein [Spirochaetota bacterium]
MNNGNRKEHRYSTCILNPERAYVEINTGIIIRGSIVDLSAGGLAFEISNPGDEISAVDKAKGYSVEIVIDSLKIVTAVQKVWGFFKNSDSESVYLSGVRFETISNDDRLKLYNVIERIRDISLSGS